MAKTLLVGFDAAWSAGNAGAIVGAMIDGRGRATELGPPQPATYRQAQSIIDAWRAADDPAATLILLDQPTIVANASGQRPVEHLVCAAISRRRGGMQPAYTANTALFGAAAPIWPFLARFGGAEPPSVRLTGSRVVETYPALVLTALGWLHPDERATGRLPKYNPRNRRFRLDDWQALCRRTAAACHDRGLEQLADWLASAGQKARPDKRDQDGLDACLCLLVGVELAHGRECLMVGDLTSGYIVVPDSRSLYAELVQRCRATGRPPSRWVRRLRLE